MWGGFSNPPMRGSEDPRHITCLLPPPPDLLEPRVASTSVPVVLVPDRIFRVVVLVVILGGPEAAGGEDVGHDALLREAALHGIARRNRGGALRFIVKVDRALVLLPF